MRADNRGEGGILALLALRAPADASHGRAGLLVGLGLFGAALLYGDGVITPAISVLGAVEGLGVATPALQPLRVAASPSSSSGALPLPAARHGGCRRGVRADHGGLVRVHRGARPPRHRDAPVGAGGAQSRGTPSSSSPATGCRASWCSASVVLVVTGGEALYADMGHFGKRPDPARLVRRGAPRLLLNYFGQGHCCSSVRRRRSIRSTRSCPSGACIRWSWSSTAAAIVASQALISGAFSLTRQAVQLGYSPRVTIVHTSKTEMGQIYIPEVNRRSGSACLALVLGFQSSTNLAAAYGIAVTGTMIDHHAAVRLVARDLWRWPAPSILGAHRPAAGRGPRVLRRQPGQDRAGRLVPARGGARHLHADDDLEARAGRASPRSCARTRCRWTCSSPTSSGGKPPRVPGTAVFLTSMPGGVPPVLLHHLKHNKVLHEKVMLMSVVTEEIPQVDQDDRVALQGAGRGVLPGDRPLRVHGDARRPGGPAGARPLGGNGKPVSVKVMETSFYLGRETLIATRAGAKLARRPMEPARPHVALAEEAVHPDDAGTPARPPRSSACRRTGSSSSARRFSSEHHRLHDFARGVTTERAKTCTEDFADACSTAPLTLTSLLR